jgi:hypothetical protein
MFVRARALRASEPIEPDVLMLVLKLSIILHSRNY